MGFFSAAVSTCLSGLKMEQQSSLLPRRSLWIWVESNGINRYTEQIVAPLIIWWKFLLGARIYTFVKSIYWKIVWQYEVSSKWCISHELNIDFPCLVALQSVFSSLCIFIFSNSGHSHSRADVPFLPYDSILFIFFKLSNQTIPFQQKDIFKGT